MRRAVTIAMIVLLTLSACGSSKEPVKQKEVKVYHYRTPKENKPVTPMQQLFVSVVAYGLVSMIIFLLQL